MRLKQINLMPVNAFRRPLLKKLQSFNRENRQLVKRAGSCGLIIFMLIIAPVVVVSHYKIKAAKLRNTITNTKIKFKKLQSQDFQLEKIKAGFKKEEARFYQRLSFLLSTVAVEGGYASGIMSIADFLPPGLWLNHIVMNKNEIQISGTTLESRLIFEFMSKLEACLYFRNIRFISSEKEVVDSHAIYNFQITAEYGTTKGDAVPALEAMKVKNGH